MRTKRAGQDVLKEELCELWSGDCPFLGRVSVRPVLVAEGHGLPVVVSDTRVGDGDAVNVAG